MPAEIPDGAVIVARAILNSSLWTMRIEDRIVALTCIMLCNRRRKKWFDGSRDIMIERGQFVRSREKLAEACNLPLQVVRTSLDHLKTSDFLTRTSTRDYTLYTLPKYHHYQDLTKYSDIVGENLTQELTRSQPQTTTPDTSPVPSEPSRRSRGGTNGSAVVVVSDSWADPILSRPSFHFSLKLLEEVKMAKSVASAFASQKPVGLILRVVQQAKLQRQPGGWARIALESEWSLPEVDKDTLGKAIFSLKLNSEKSGSSRSRGSSVDSIRERFPRKSGESDDQWFRRASQALVLEKKGAKK